MGSARSRLGRETCVCGNGSVCKNESLARNSSRATIRPSQIDRKLDPEAAPTREFWSGCDRGAQAIPEVLAWPRKYPSGKSSLPVY